MATKTGIIIDTAGVDLEGGLISMASDEGVKANGLTELECCTNVASMMTGPLSKMNGVTAVLINSDKDKSIDNDYINHLLKRRGWKKEYCIYIRLQASFSSSSSVTGCSYAVKGGTSSEGYKMVKEIVRSYERYMKKDFSDKGGNVKANRATTGSKSTALTSGWRASAIFHIFNIRNKASTNMYRHDTQSATIELDKDNPLKDFFKPNSFTSSNSGSMVFAMRAAASISTGIAVYLGKTMDSPIEEVGGSIGIGGDIVGSITGSGSNYTGTKFGEDYDFSDVDFSGLLASTYEEKKYGPGIAQITQPLIKFSNAEFYNMGGENQTATDVLKQYAKFYLEMNNSRIKVASLTMLGCPWIRPGFNVWVDPIYTDKIYYVDSVTHSGSPQMGVMTQLSLVHGRTREDFVNGKGFGSINDSGNVFTGDKYIKNSSNFGPTLKKASDYSTVASNLKKFNSSYEDKVIRACESGYKAYYDTAMDYDKSTNSPSILKKDSATGKEIFKKDEWEAITGVGYKSGKPISLKQESSNSLPNEIYTGKSFSLSRTLKKGSKGTEVKTLQKVLNTLNGVGIVSGDKLSVDGDFGKSTDSILKEYQKASNLKEDGIIGPGGKTLKAINSDLKEINEDVGTNKVVKTGTGRLSQSLFTGSYNLSEIEASLSNIYKKAPEVVKTRRNAIEKGIKAARDTGNSVYTNNNWRNK